MPARIVVVHDESEVLGPLVFSLKERGYDVAPFADPIRALSDIEGTPLTDVLIARMHPSPGRQGALSFARMARSKHPAILIILTGHHSLTSLADGWGEFLHEPLDPEEIANTVARMLRELG
jgi:DNA-binding response OmpR family regulator